MYHHEVDYRAHWLGCSATPAICVDESGIVAIAYSVIDMNRVSEMEQTNKYPRSVFVSYIEPPYAIGDGLWDAENPANNYTAEPGNYFINMEYLQDIEDEDWGFQHSGDEAIWVNSITNTVNREFWFAFQADPQVGLNQSGEGHTQAQPTDNILWVVKVVPDNVIDNVEEQAVNPMTSTRVYPNPATDQIGITLSQNADIVIYNIMGQNVMNVNENFKSINIDSLQNGIYFVRLKTNDGEKTVKLVIEK